MKTNEEDPLRFLKPRKKQFHLTPTKPVKQKPKEICIANNSLEQSRQQQGQTIFVERNHRKQASTVDLRPSQIFNYLDSAKQKYQPIINGNSENKLYNPSKYFSSQVENFLRNKRGFDESKDSSIDQQKKSKVETAIEKQQKSYQNYSGSMIQSKPFTKEKTKQSIKVENMQIKFSQNKAYTEIQPKSVSSILIETGPQRNQQKTAQNIQSNLITTKQSSTLNSVQIQKKIQTNQINQMQAQNIFSSKDKNFSNSYGDEFEEVNGDMQLKVCPICNRKFNPNSYEKHVKVCEKVFYNKRKQFSSQKQRSLSKKKK